MKPDWQRAIGFQVLGAVKLRLLHWTPRGGQYRKTPGWRERDGSDTGMPSDPPKTPIVCRGRASIEQSRKSVFRMDGQLLELLGAAYEWTGMAK
ncbi:hypothetical protein Q3G72_010751 [Acer saccharum]|nr:hypothetical protein Q3G72_012517 [Acer saccharum]KAK1591635.1 hypothetical protein Q3G72_010751 [Acer saccharum]